MRMVDRLFLLGLWIVLVMMPDESVELWKVVVVIQYFAYITIRALFFDDDSK